MGYLLQFASGSSEYSTSNSKLAIAMLDIDHFKLVNDNYGHDIGDQVLIQFVDTLHKNSRKNDILVRWGGEEFIMILKIDEASNLQKILESLRKSIESFDFNTVGHKTCSIGGTIYLEYEDSWFKALFADAWSTPNKLKQTINISLYSRDNYIEFHKALSLRQLIEQATQQQPHPQL